MLLAAAHSTLEASGLHVLVATAHLLLGPVLLILTLSLRAAAASLIEHALSLRHLLLHHGELLLLRRLAL